MLNWFNEGIFKRQYSTHSFSFHLVDKIVFPLKITGKAEWQYGAGDAKSPAGLNMDFNHDIQSSQWESNPEPSWYDADGGTTVDVLENFLVAVLISQPWRSHPSPHAFQWKHAKRSISDGSISHRNRQFCQVEAQHWGLVHSRKCQNAI